MRKHLVASILTAAFALPATAHAALKLTYQRTRAGGATQINTMTVDSRHMRMDGLAVGQHGPQAPAGDESVVLDADGKRMLMIYPARKAYKEMTEADFKQLKDKMAQMRTQMAERMKNMPPEQRKMMESMMGGKMGAGMGALNGGEAPAVKYEPLGKKKTVAGFACEMYRVSVSSMAMSEMCIAPWSGNLVTKAEVAEFKKLAEDLRQLFDMGMGMQSQDFSKVPGVPVEDTHFGPDGKTVEWTNTLKAIDRGAVPASTFQVPAGYSKEAMPLGGPQDGMPPGRGRPR